MRAAGERVVVVGGGVFGLSSALELRRRGHAVDVLDAGEIPNPLAGGTDISKVCRLEYGTDALYMEWMETAREGWLEWNAAWRAAGEAELYHETGVLMVSLGPMRPGTFEYESYAMLRRRGHAPERIGGSELARRFPAWSPQFEDGFYHAKGGWTESGRVVEFLASEARRAGVGVHPHEGATALVVEGGAVRGVRASEHEWPAEHVVLACGSWLAQLVPELAPALRRSYHPVWHLRPERPERFAGERFPVFTADINNTGFYGFPHHPVAKVVKVAHHGATVEPGPGGELTVDANHTAAFRAFLAQRLPVLADAEVVFTRLCPYCDSQDEDFWIAPDPERPGLTIAGGGSGHAFKFAPVLGAVVADAVEGVDHPLLERFRWRPEVRLEHGREASRCHSVGELR